MATRNIRLFAILGANVLYPKTRHVVGFPRELAGDRNEPQTLPAPDVLVIEQEDEGSVFLYRMTRSGEAGGDTWHQSVDDARHQAEYEYGNVLGEWQTVPENVTDAREFAIAKINEK